jgi:ribosome-associated toxin RatA of RatAB toxin-antitoxin module
MVREMVKDTDVDNNMEVSYDEFLPWCAAARLLTCSPCCSPS